MNIVTPSEDLSAVIEALVLAQSHLDAFKAEMPKESSSAIANIEFGIDWTASRTKALQKKATQIGKPAIKTVVADREQFE